MSIGAARPAKIARHRWLAMLFIAMLPGSALAMDNLPPLVDAKWLAARLGDDAFAVLDIRSPIGGADRQSYLRGHIPGSVYSDFMADRWHDQGSAAPTTLPPVTQLEALLGDLGVGNQDTVVVVHGGNGSSDFSTAARVYWTLRLLGHDRVTILDGGMRAWVQAGMPLEQGWNEPRPARFRATTFRTAWIATTAQVEEALRTGAQLVDARSREMYAGHSKPPLVPRAGTLPGAINLEHRRLIDPDTGRVASTDALATLLREVGLGDPSREVVAFCNFGQLSAAAWFVLHELAGFSDVTVYDGSMAEWGAAAGRPVVAAAGMPGQ
jgi:thiosulfate/3-mercaptopyruvate sulfurtransferase